VRPTCLDYMTNMTGTAYPLRLHGFTRRFLVGSALVIFFVLFVVLCLCVLFVIVRCFVCPINTNPLNCSEKVSRSWSAGGISRITVNKGNNKITELRTILQRESQNS
jgi:hypothetical protein